MMITASAPGKTILMGEHAAVYGRPALVAAVDRRLFAELREVHGQGVRLELEEIAVSESIGWPEIRHYARTARERWQTYAEQPSPASFARVRGEDPAHLVKVALGEAAEMLGEDEPPAVALRLRSRLPMGAGFGSSAACAVAIVHALSSLCGVPVSMATLEGVSLEVERRQHGAPSGIDSATVIHGGLVWALRDAAGRFRATPIQVSAPALAKIRVFNSGTPEESTGEVVAAVRARRDADPEGFERLLDRMAAATEEGRRQLTTEASEPADLVAPIREIEACLEQAGVVPPRLREIVRQVESRGGAAKISGAGATRGGGAGSLLVYHPQPEEIDGWRFLDELERLDMQLGAPGVRIEERVG